MPRSGVHPLSLYDTILTLADANLQDDSPIAAIPRYAIVMDDFLLRMKIWGRVTWTPSQLDRLEEDDPPKFSSITKSLDQMVVSLQKLQSGQAARSSEAIEAELHKIRAIASELKKISGTKSRQSRIQTTPDPPGSTAMRPVQTINPEQDSILVFFLAPPIAYFAELFSLMLEATEDSMNVSSFDVHVERWGGRRYCVEAKADSEHAPEELVLRMLDFAENEAHHFAKDPVALLHAVKSFIHTCSCPHEPDSVSHAEEILATRSLDLLRQRYRVEIQPQSLPEKFDYMGEQFANWPSSIPEPEGCDSEVLGLAQTMTSSRSDRSVDEPWSDQLHSSFTLRWG